jgi:hypothetical protein
MNRLEFSSLADFYGTYKMFRIWYIHKFVDFQSYPVLMFRRSTLRCWSLPSLPSSTFPRSTSLTIQTSWTKGQPQSSLFTSVADPGCLSRIRIFSSRILDQGSKRFRITNQNIVVPYFYQCCGSGSTGSTCFWASWIRIQIHKSEVWIRILLSLSKNSVEKP